jgi:hypothetical protein
LSLSDVLYHSGMNQDIQQLQNFLHDNQRVLVLTGAGLSTASGIPDYRDKDGVRRGRNPIQGPDFRKSEAVRRRYWARSMAGYPTWPGPRPTPATMRWPRWRGWAHPRHHHAERRRPAHARRQPQADRAAWEYPRRGVPRLPPVHPRAEIQHWLAQANPNWCRPARPARWCRKRVPTAMPRWSSTSSSISSCHTAPPAAALAAGRDLLRR